MVHGNKQESGMATALELARKCSAVIEHMEGMLGRLERGATQVSLDGADLIRSHIEATARIIDQLRRLHGGLSEHAKAMHQRPPAKHDEEAEPDTKTLLKQLLAARKNVLQQIEWVKDPPIMTSGLTGSEMRHVQIEMQLRDLDHTLNELDECIEGLKHQAPEPPTPN
jgi:hypothetical protein